MNLSPKLENESPLAATVKYGRNMYLIVVLYNDTFALFIIHCLHFSVIIFCLPMCVLSLLVYSVSISICTANSICYFSFVCCCCCCGCNLTRLLNTGFLCFLYCTENK